MWYEIIPSFLVITAALGLPGWGLYHIHNLTLGNVSLTNVLGNKGLLDFKLKYPRTIDNV